MKLSAVAWFGVAQVPKPLMRGDKTFHVAPPCAIGRQGPSGQHHFQHEKKLFRDLKVRLIAGVMKRDQNFV